MPSPQNPASGLLVLKVSLVMFAVARVVSAHVSPPGCTPVMSGELSITPNAIYSGYSVEYSHFILRAEDVNPCDITGISARFCCPQSNGTPAPGCLSSADVCGAGCTVLTCPDPSLSGGNDAIICGESVVCVVDTAPGVTKGNGRLFAFGTSHSSGNNTEASVIVPAGVAVLPPCAASGGAGVSRHPTTVVDGGTVKFSNFSFNLGSSSEPRPCPVSDLVGRFCCPGSNGLPVSGCGNSGETCGPGCTALSCNPRHLIQPSASTMCSNPGTADGSVSCVVNTAEGVTTASGGLLGIGTASTPSGHQTFLLLLPTEVLVEPSTNGPCTGDVNGDNAVSLSELQVSVNNFLGHCSRYTDNGDGTVTDNDTGLMWQKTVDDGSAYDKDNTYSWSASSNLPNGTAFATFLNAINGGTAGVGNCVSSDGRTQSGGLAGHCDWRLPTIAELLTIVQSGSCSANPCINQAVFGPVVANSVYWSASTLASSPDSAVNVLFASGTGGATSKTSSLKARAVRSAGRGGRFVDNGNGTVTDKRTGLTWEKKTNDGSIHDKDNGYSWTTGTTLPSGTVFTTFLNTLNGGTSGVGNCTSTDFATQSGGFAGHCDWRLPTIAELRTILLEDLPCSTTPCIDQSMFGPTQSSVYWSATTRSGTTSNAYYLTLSGSGSVGNNPKTSFNYARAVRGGSR